MFRHKKSPDAKTEAKDEKASDKANGSAKAKEVLLNLQSHVAVHSEDDDDSEDDPDAGLKDIRNLKKGGPPNDATDLRGHMDRYDEFTSYTNRSERSHARPDPSPSMEELMKRSTKFKDDVTFHSPDGDLTEEEIRAYFMQEEDFKRCDTDVELTTFRWEKHKKGSMTFDEEQNTLRGLEDVLLYDEKREKARVQHTQSILAEVMKQRVKGNMELDWEKIRHVAEKTSKPAAEQAAKIGAMDAKDAAVGVRASTRYPPSKASKSTKQKDSKSGGRPAAFARLRYVLSFKKPK